VLQNRSHWKGNEAGAAFRNLSRIKMMQYLAKFKSSVRSTSDSSALPRSPLCEKSDILASVSKNNLVDINWHL
jgi:hypothetical protein